MPLRRADERGFTLVEVLVAATVLVIGVLGALTMLDGANRSTTRTKAREAGVNLAREAIEAVRAVPYPELVPSQVETELRSQPGLADASTDSGWQVKRRDVVFTLVASVCSVDDGTLASDGYGNHAGGFFCADSTATGTTDNNPDDYKRVAIDVTWKDGADVRTARQEAVINNPGSAFAPAVKVLAPVTGQQSPITNPSLKLITFNLTTSSRAQEVKWSLDNVSQGNATATNAGKTAWTFTWDTTEVVDGTYLVAAEAYDQFGQSGTGRVYTMQLNRYQPAPPTGFAGGRNPLWGASFAEFEWNPNPERDVVGYRVYRMPAGALIPAATDAVVCETNVDEPAPTQCIDASAPPLGPLTNTLLHYYVVALAPARTGSGLEESPRPSLAGTLAVTPNDGPTWPADATGFQCATTGDGATVQWPDATDVDGIRYYRIYRDDNSHWNKRVDRTGAGTENALTDPDGASTSHTYWITAVDNRLAESAMASIGCTP